VQELQDKADMVEFLANWLRGQENDRSGSLPDESAMSAND
jgi:hypothetical protein